MTEYQRYIKTENLEIIVFMSISTIKDIMIFTNSDFLYMNIQKT